MAKARDAIGIMDRLWDMTLIRVMQPSRYGTKMIHMEILLSLCSEEAVRRGRCSKLPITSHVDAISASSFRWFNTAVDYR